MREKDTVCEIVAIRSYQVLLWAGQMGGVTCD